MHYITALHGIQAVHPSESCPSVRYSIKRVDCDNAKESSAYIFYTMWKNVYPSFPTHE